jgi:Na+-transporting NADH:ubiquinone oxidoreductase subunit NqrC
MTTIIITIASQYSPTNPRCHRRAPTRRRIVGSLVVVVVVVISILVVPSTPFVTLPKMQSNGATYCRQRSLLVRRHILDVFIFHSICNLPLS